MKKTPNKAEALKILDTAGDRLSAIEEDVKWAANLGFSPKVRPQQRVSGGGHGDVTGTVAGTQEVTRAQVRKVFGLVGALEEVMDKLDSELAYLFARADSRKDYAADMPTGEHAKKIKALPVHPPSRGELKALRQKQADRRKQGEGYGIA